MPAPAMAVRGGTASNGKTSFTSDQAATALLREGRLWSTAGTPATVTYAYRATGSTTVNGVSGFAPFDATQIASAERALQAWADVANITFQRVGSGTSGAGAYSDNATILFGSFTQGNGFDGAFAYLPGSRAATSVSGDVWFPTGDVQWAIVHETGHAIGLSHPGDYDGAGFSYASSAAYFEDSKSYSVMSYFSPTNTGGVGYYESPSTPMVDDIVAIQRAYGANMTTRAGDTVYGFNTNAGAIYAGTATAPYTVWDGGGTDTFDFSGNTKTQTIDLRAGAFSTINARPYSIAIAYGVTIENAIGGSAADTLIGNAAANRLEGRDGNDTLYGEDGDDTLLSGAGNDSLEGGAGADRLDGGAGIDTLVGGTGDDIYLVDALGDVIVEAAGAGRDTVLASASYVLANGVSVEALALADATSTAALFLTGNDLNQIITGNAGANILNGGGGTGDTLVGLGGDDTYLVRGLGDVVIEERGGGNDLVYTTVSYNLGEYEIEFLSTVQHTDTTPINLIGNYYSSTLIGNYGDNILNGGSGADTLTGLKGNDTYAVADSRIVINEADGEGFDTVVTSVSYTLGAAASIEVLAAQDRGAPDALVLRGNAFAQTIAGNAGANTLNGGGGADTLLGLGGADLFQFDTALGGGNVDTIVDFLPGTDLLALASTVFTALPKVLSAGNLVTGPVALDADDYLVFDPASGQIFYDSDGNGAAIQILFATLTPGLALTAANIQVYTPEAVPVPTTSI